MDLMSSNSFLMLEKSLGYLWTKQAAIADNITNAETPGYKEKGVPLPRDGAGGPDPDGRQRRQRHGPDVGGHPQRLSDALRDELHLDGALHSELRDPGAISGGAIF